MMFDCIRHSAYNPTRSWPGAKPRTPIVIWWCLSVLRSCAFLITLFWFTPVNPYKFLDQNGGAFRRDLFLPFVCSWITNAMRRCSRSWSFLAQFDYPTTTWRTSTTRIDTNYDELATNGGTWDPYDSGVFVLPATDVPCHLHSWWCITWRTAISGVRASFDRSCTSKHPCVHFHDEMAWPMSVQGHFCNKRSYFVRTFFWSTMPFCKKRVFCWANHFVRANILYKMTSGSIS